jgi:oxygen-independent coproporphyrinogen-3 oxidase
VIERLMCDLAFSRADLSRRFGPAAGAVIEEADVLLGADEDGFLERTADGFIVTERGRPFIRSICSCFDVYLGRSTARHAPGV